MVDHPSSLPPTPHERVSARVAALLLLGAAGMPPADVPVRRFGADWFREQPDWLAASAAADHLTQDAALDPGPALRTAAELLETAGIAPDDLEPDVPALVEVGFVEAMICSASHLEPGADSRLVSASPGPVWRVWHRRRERLEALSEQRSAAHEPPPGLSDPDPAVAMIARCTTYRAESGRYVVLANLISADRPSPWPLRHPLLVALLFAAVLGTFLLISLLTA